MGSYNYEEADPQRVGFLHSIGGIELSEGSAKVPLRSSDFVDDEPMVLTPYDAKKEALRLPFLGCPMGFEPMTFRTTI